jgi:hypothetical protein
MKDSEMREIQKIARSQHMTVSEWVRHALRIARRQQTTSKSRNKIDLVRAAAEHRFPTGDIDRMLAEIEQGYLSKGAN